MNDDAPGRSSDSKPFPWRTPVAVRFIPSVAVLISLALLFSGCTTLHTVPPSGLVNLTNVVQVGDRVDCTLRDGTHNRFKVTAVEPSALVGGPFRLPAAEIDHIDLERFDAATTNRVVLGVVLIGGLVALEASARGRWNIFQSPF